jgi:hypothetical protein
MSGNVSCLRKISQINKRNQISQLYWQKEFLSVFGIKDVKDTVISSVIEEKYVIKKNPELKGIPSNGIIEYIGRTKNDNEERWANDRIIFVPPTSKEKWLTSFNLFRQFPWKKIKGKTILKVKLRGALQINPSASSNFIGGPKDFETIDSLADMITLLNYAAHDPRILSIILDIRGVTSGYAKLVELKRWIDYFQQSGKEITAYCSNGAEKELFIGMACNSFYVPPDGALDLRGFASSAQFFRGIFNKIGIEPQVQRIGNIYYYISCIYIYIYIYMNILCITLYIYVRQI